MQISGITPEQFSEIVRKVSDRDYGGNLQAKINSQQSPKRFRAQVMLQNTGFQLWGGKDTSLLAPGQRRSGNGLAGNRRINAVCWHGFRDVFVELFDQYPEAKITTGLAKYRGRDEFYRNYPPTAHKNIGSMAYPMTMPETCDCEA